MNLLNYTLKYLSIIFFVVISLWAVLFYFNMMDEVYDSIDDGLENYKMLIINKAEKDTRVFHKTAFNEGNYIIRDIPKEKALYAKDVYKDSLIYTINEEDYEPVRVLTTVFEHSGKYYELQIITSMVEEDDLIEDLLYALIWLYISLLIVVVFINNVVLRKLWKPFYKILDELRNYKLGKTEKIEEINVNVKEFKELKYAVDELLRKSSTTYANQKQFIENASHELQTPLAICINKLELMAEKNNYTDTQLQYISEVIEVLHRLVRLNKSLLQLSKIENNQFRETETVNITEVIRKQLKDFRDLSDHKQVNIKLNSHEELFVNMNEDLANILITNLLKNAIIHNVSGGVVEITAAKDRLLICNTGESSALDREKVFSRFYKKTNKSASTGLGLAIVKAIIDAYDFSIIYFYKDKHCMELYF